jgi:DNA-directed RNA polymerase specialized sigma24 family protein
MSNDLMKRLRRTVTAWDTEGEKYEVLLNPDGPDAADRIEELEAENELLQQMIASLPPPHPDNTLRNRLAQRRAKLKGETDD